MPPKRTSRWGPARSRAGEAGDVEPGASRDRLGAAVEPAQHADPAADPDDPVLLVPADVRRRQQRRVPASRRPWSSSLAAITDWLDGWLARKQGLVTTFGKIADPLADKALTGVALIGLSVLGELWWWVTILIILREVGVTLIRFVVLKHGVIPASRGGKAKTLFQMVGIALFLLPIASDMTAAVVGPQRRHGDRRDPHGRDRPRLHQQGVPDAQQLEVRQGGAQGRRSHRRSPGAGTAACWVPARSPGSTAAHLAGAHRVTRRPAGPVGARGATRRT